MWQLFILPLNIYMSCSYLDRGRLPAISVSVLLTINWKRRIVARMITLMLWSVRLPHQRNRISGTLTYYFYARLTNVDERICVNFVIIHLLRITSNWSPVERRRSFVRLFADFRRLNGRMIISQMIFHNKSTFRVAAFAKLIDTASAWRDACVIRQCVIIKLRMQNPTRWHIVANVIRR